jgi:hypothetical protein
LLAAIPKFDEETLQRLVCAGVIRAGLGMHFPQPERNEDERQNQTAKDPPLSRELRFLLIWRPLHLATYYYHELSIAPAKNIQRSTLNIQ